MCTLANMGYMDALHEHGTNSVADHVRGEQMSKQTRTRQDGMRTKVQLQ